MSLLRFIGQGRNVEFASFLFPPFGDPIALVDDCSLPRAIALASSPLR